MKPISVIQYVNERHIKSTDRYRKNDSQPSCIILLVCNILEKFIKLLPFFNSVSMQ